MREKFRRLPLRNTSRLTNYLSLGLLLWSAVDPDRIAQSLPPRRDSEGVPLPAGARTLIGVVGNLPHASAIAFSPDGKILATVGPRHTQLWDVATGKYLRECRPQPHATASCCKSILFARDGRILLRASSDRAVASWDVATGKRIRTIYTTDPGISIASFVASPDGKHLLVEVGKNGELNDENAYLLVHQLQLWHLAESKLVRSFQKAKYQRMGDGEYFGCLAFAPSGKTVAAADHSGTIILWDVATGSIVREILTVNEKWAVANVAFSADSRSLLSTDCRNPRQSSSMTLREGRALSLRIRDVATGKERFSIADVGAASPCPRMATRWRYRMDWMALASSS